MVTESSKGERIRVEMAGLLAHLLADEFLLLTKTLNAQWNVEKPGFYSVRMIFIIQFRQINEILDRIAERLQFLGFSAVVALKQFLELSHLTETAFDEGWGELSILELCEDHRCIMNFVKSSLEPLLEDINDERTSVFIACLLEEHQKMVLTLIALC